MSKALYTRCFYILHPIMRVRLPHHIYIERDVPKITAPHRGGRQNKGELTKGSVEWGSGCACGFVVSSGCVRVCHLDDGDGDDYDDDNNDDDDFNCDDDEDYDYDYDDDDG